MKTVTANGVCPKKKGVRDHDMRAVKDGEGRTCIACHRCGAAIINTGRVTVV